MPDSVNTVVKDGVTWRAGSQADVDWIAAGTDNGNLITAVIPPLYEAYATLTNVAGEPGLPRDLALECRQDLAFVELLRRHSGDMPWWIGYLDTGASDIVFWDVPKLTLYGGWNYVFVLAGADQAATWRPAPGGQPNWKSTELPEVIFPKDHSWLVSFLWDDDWAYIGGPDALISDILSDPLLGPNARRVVDTQEDPAPPGNWPG